VDIIRLVKKPAKRGEGEASDLTTAVRGEAYAEAIPIAVARWGKTRAPSLAALVDRLAARAPGAAPEIVTYDFAASKLSDAEDVVAVSARLKPDPRVAAKLTAMLLAPPFTSLGSRGLWTPLLEALGDRHADPRTIDALAPVAGEYTRVFGATKMGEQMQRGVRKLLDELRKRFVDVTHDDEATALLKTMPADPPKPAGKPTNGDDLLAAIYANPDDDQSRLVYADWLLERGDPRGEFIALQVRRHRGEAVSEEDEKREAQLVKKHMKDWLGPIYGVTRKDNNVFARGFLEECVFQPRNPASALAADQPGWATVRDLEVSNGGTNDSGESVLARPAMRHMRILRHCDGPLLEAILEQPDFELEELHLAWFGSRRRGYDENEPWERLLAGKGLPRLKRLVLGHEIYLELSRFRELVTSPLVERLDLLALSSLWDRVLEPVTELMRSLRLPAKFELRVGDPMLHEQARWHLPPEVELERRSRPPKLVMRRGASGAYEKA
jgi:uncharacterized protein (TIGR02996 family)